MASPPAAPRGALGPLALLAVWLLATIGWRPLGVPDEGRYAEVARSMLLGDGLTPLLAGLPFFHKPPLTYWVDMGAMAVFGVHAFSARFAPALGGWLMGAALFLALRRWHGEAVARRALLVLATCPLFFFGAQYANHDMLVAGLVAATLFAFARALDAPRPELRWLIAAWALAALGVLAKGLIGLVLPALVIGPWLLARGRWRELLRLLHPLGLAVFAAIALPWFVLMQQRHPQFFDYFVMEQHFRRYGGTTFNNGRPAWFFPAVLLLLALPWTLWLPRALAGLRARWHGADPALRAWLAFLGWWLVAITLFFSLPRSKLVGYVLPVLAPWCALLAAGTRGRPRPFAATAATSALISVVGVAAIAWKAPGSSQVAARQLAAQIAPGDRVVFVDDMFYDLPYIAQLASPPIVASRWDDPDIPKRDNWRKELSDAARFDPARARTQLWPIERLGELSCGEHRLWLVLGPGNRPRLAAVPGAQVVGGDDKALLALAPARRCD